MRKETGEESGRQILPDVEIILQEFLLSLVATPHMITPTLVGDKLPVGLDHHGVEVLHAVQDVSGHGVAGSERQSVLDQTLNSNVIYYDPARGIVGNCIPHIIAL